MQGRSEGAHGARTPPAKYFASHFFIINMRKGIGHYIGFVTELLKKYSFDNSY